MRSSSNRRPVVDCQPAADVDEVILLGAHPGGVGVTAKFCENFGDGFARIAFFAFLNEIGIFHHACRIEINLDAVLVAQGAQGFDVRHADGLSACHVDRASHADVGDIVRANFVDQCLHFVEVNVALEWMQVCGIVRFVNDDIGERAARQFLMQARGGEIHIAGNILSLFDNRLTDEMFRAASLMRGDDILVAVHFLDSRFKMIEVAAARVGFIAHHHARPLTVTHRAGAAVGQQVNVHII